MPEYKAVQITSIDDVQDALDEYAALGWRLASTLSSSGRWQGVLIFER